MEKGKKFIALFLISSLLMLSTNLYAKERRGAELIIQRIGDQARKVKRTQLDGTPWETTDITGIWGELIAVKPNSLLLLDASGKDVSADIADIKAIRIMKKSKFWTGAGIGVLIGGAAGAILGYSSGDDDPGAGAGKDKTFQIEGMPDSEIQKTLDKLRKKARIRDYK